MMILDDVDHSMTHPSNRMLVWDGAVERIVSLSLQKQTNQLRLDKVLLAPGSLETLEAKIRSYWRKAPFRAEAFALFDEWLHQSSSWTTMLEAVRSSTIIADSRLGLGVCWTPPSSALDVTSTKATRLVDLTLKVGGQELVLGGGGKLYATAAESEFSASSIRLQFQDWCPTVPNRSILDTVAWYGSDRVLDLIA